MTSYDSLTSRVDQALRTALRPGQNIVVGQAYGTPAALLNGLERHVDLLAGSQVFVGMLLDKFPHLPGVAVKTFFPSGPLGSTDALDQQNAQYTRQTLYELSSGFLTGDIPVDVVLAQSTDEYCGEHSLGVSVDYLSAAIGRANVVVLETGPRVPWSGPKSTVSASDRVIPIRGSAGPLVLDRQPSQRDITIAHHVSRWIPDGATIQLGMGPWASAVASLSTQRSDLRIHSGLISDWVRTLDVAGCLNQNEPIVATGAAGTDDFYRWLERSHRVELVGAHVSHSPAVLDALPKLRTVNSVLEVDLLGRANAEIGYGGRRGGIGGLPDFAAAAAKANDGLSIIALSATSGDHSRIVPRLESNAVSLEAGMVDVIVTEFGSAYLRGRSMTERARAIIEIASPAQRAQLREEATRILG